MGALQVATSLYTPSALPLITSKAQAAIEVRALPK
jgi:hypothetical protein